MPAIRYRTAFSFPALQPLQVCPGWQQVRKSLWDSPCPCEQQEIKFRSIRSLQCSLKLDWLLTHYIYHCQCEPVPFRVPNAGSINVIANKASSWILKKADTQTLFILPWYWKWNSSGNRLFLSLWMYMGKTQIHVFYLLSSMKAILYLKSWRNKLWKIFYGLSIYFFVLSFLL